MSGNKRVLRIRVTNGDKPKANITVPLGLVRLARLGGIADRLSKEHGIDLDEILTGIEDSPDGPLVDVVDEKSGDHVEISIGSDVEGSTPQSCTLAPDAEQRGREDTRVRETVWP